MSNEIKSQAEYQVIREKLERHEEWETDWCGDLTSFRVWLRQYIVLDKKAVIAIIHREHPWGIHARVKLMTVTEFKPKSAAIVIIDETESGQK